MPANNNAHLLCQHLTKAGHHCHMPLSAGHQSLCTHHLHIAKREAVRHAETAASQRDDSADLSALFSTDLPKQKSAADIHTHLWNLSLALQQGRISPRRAAVLAYISSLLLRTLPAIEKKEHPVDRGGLTIGDAPRPIRNLPPPHHPPSQYSPGAYATPSSCVPSAPKLYGFRPATPSAASSFPRGECGESSDSHPAFSASSAVAATPAALWNDSRDVARLSSRLPRGMESVLSIAEGLP